MSICWIESDWFRLFIFPTSNLSSVIVLCEFHFSSSEFRLVFIQTKMWMSSLQCQKNIGLNFKYVFKNKQDKRQYTYVYMSKMYIDEIMLKCRQLHRYKFQIDFLKNQNSNYISILPTKTVESYNFFFTHEWFIKMLECNANEWIPLHDPHSENYAGVAENARFTRKSIFWKLSSSS